MSSMVVGVFCPDKITERCKSRIPSKTIRAGTSVWLKMKSAPSIRKQQCSTSNSRTTPGLVANNAKPCFSNFMNKFIQSNIEYAQRRLRPGAVRDCRFEQGQRLVALTSFNHGRQGMPGSTSVARPRAMPGTLNYILSRIVWPETRKRTTRIAVSVPTA
ncbi:unnamed protein product [Nesidiocoris tenuis]|uniref:Uncharacterized protein n=1 Tax=Nesidiocoris tenuis TaxID=355587 RepID=A0A6H5GZL1_9HEMI|nr:unnamed protein product [Nesidiocoris tenuis]